MPKRKPIRLTINGTRLHPRFSGLVLKALRRLKPLEPLPPIPAGYVHVLMSDGTHRAVLPEQIAEVWRTDNNLRVVQQREIFRSDGTHFFVSVTRPPFYPPVLSGLPIEERAVLHTLRRLAFMDPT